MLDVEWLMDVIMSFLPAELASDQHAEPSPGTTVGYDNNIWTDEMRDKLLRLRIQGVPFTQIIAQVRRLPSNIEISTEIPWLTLQAQNYFPGKTLRSLYLKASRSKDRLRELVEQMGGGA